MMFVRTSPLLSSSRTPTVTRSRRQYVLWLSCPMTGLLSWSSLNLTFHQLRVTSTEGPRDNTVNLSENFSSTSTSLFFLNQESGRYLVMLGSKITQACPERLRRKVTACVRCGGGWEAAVAKVGGGTASRLLTLKGFLCFRVWSSRPWKTRPENIPFPQKVETSQT